MHTFIEQIIEVSKDIDLVNEVKNIKTEELKKTTPNDNEDYVFGAEYKKGSFITDPDNNTIYKRRYPLFYYFLKDWHNLS